MDDFLLVMTVSALVRGFAEDIIVFEQKILTSLNPKEKNEWTTLLTSILNVS